MAKGKSRIEVFRREIADVSVKRAFAIITLSLLVIGFGASSAMWLAVGLVFFFVGFNALEAMLPSLVSRQAFAGGRGTAMGVYSTCQFLGIFAGGALGGQALGIFGIPGLLVLCFAVLMFWWLLVLSMREPRKCKTIVLAFNTEQFSAEQFIAEVTDLAGVIEVTVVGGAHNAYVKVERNFEHSALTPFALGGQP